jgi:hypothetical protein
MTDDVQESEINLTIMSDKLADAGYIDQMLVTTKLQILDDISKTTNRDLKALVEQHCKEAFDYPELVKKYNLPVSKPSKPRKLKLKMRRSKKSTTAAETTTSDPVVETTTSDPVVETTTPKSDVTPPQPDHVVETTTPGPVVETTTPKSDVTPQQPEPVVETTTPKSDVTPPQPDHVVETTIPEPVVETTTPKSDVPPTTPKPVTAPIKKPQLKRRRKEKKQETPIENSA